MVKALLLREEDKFVKFPLPRPPQDELTQGSMNVLLKIQSLDRYRAAEDLRSQSPNSSFYRQGD